jgi:hypothetical protein
MSVGNALLNVAISQIQLGPYRPPNWGSQKQLYSMTCTLPGTPAATVSYSSSVGGVVTPGSTGSSTSPGTTGKATTYFFDATLRVEHTQEAVMTKHPVQVGPAIVDHIYLLPSRVILEVAISDALQSYLTGQYGGGQSRSVNAYQTFLQIMKARVPIALATRLNAYTNMGLIDVRANEDYRTIKGFRGSLHFEQIISSTLSDTPTSARPNATNTTNEGTSGNLMNDITGLNFPK